MAINFPSSPAVNDLYTFSNKTWKWNGTGWQQITNTPSLTIVSRSANYTTTINDANTGLLHPGTDGVARTFTIDSNANVPYPIGTVLTFINDHGAGVVTISVTSDTMRLAVLGTTGSRTLAMDGIATAIKIGTTSWLIYGSGLT